MLVESLARTEHSLLKEPNSPTLWNDYGVILRTLHRMSEAKTAFEKAIRANPKYADAWSNLGSVLLLLDASPKTVERALKTAIVLDPGHNEAPCHLADFYLGKKRFEEAIKILKTYLRFYPDRIPSQKKLIDALTLNKEFEETAKLLESLPDSEQDEAFYAISGVAYGELGQVSKAQAAFRKSAAFLKRPSPLQWKHLSYCPTLFSDSTEIEEYWSRLNHDLDEALSDSPRWDWKKLPCEGFTPSFNLPHLNRCCREVKEKFDRLFAPSFPHKRPEMRKEVRYGNKIRVGFLTTGGHEGGFLRTQGKIVRRLNPERFDVTVIYDRNFENIIQNYFKENPQIHFFGYGSDFSQTVQGIREQKFDIISYWKVGADAWNQFLPATFPAPVQCTAWGTHGTSGVSAVDYYLSDAKTEIAESQNHYTEKLFLLPMPPLLEDRVKKPEGVKRNEFGLPEHGTFYFCPHRLPKYHPYFDMIFRGVLENDPKGFIVLLSEKNSYWDRFLKERLKKHLGESIFSRIVFFSKLSLQHYYRLFSLADLVLESPYYAGGNTGYDAFSFGIPCVTLSGQLLIQRYTSAIYQKMKIDGLVGNNINEYINIAVQIGSNLDFRLEKSQEILTKSSLIFDDLQTVDAWEKFFVAATA